MKIYCCRLVAIVFLFSVGAWAGDTVDEKVLQEQMNSIRMMMDPEGVKAKEISKDDYSRANEMFAAGDLAGALSVLEEGLPKLEKMDPKRGDFLIGIGNCRFELGRYDSSIKAFLDAADFFQTIGSEREEEGLRMAAGVGLETYDLPKAESLFLRALERKKTVLGFNGLSVAYLGMGNPGKALTCLQEGLALVRKNGETSSIDVVYANMGKVYLDLGDYLKALDYLDRAMEMSRMSGNKRVEAEALARIGEVHYRQGEDEEALRYFLQAIELKAAVKESIEPVVISVADIYIRQGKWNDANQLLERPLPNSKYSQVIPFGLAKFYLAKKDYSNAESQLNLTRLGSALKEKMQDKSFLAVQDSAFGRVYEGQKKFEDALKSYLSSVDIYEKMRDSLPDAQRLRFLSGEDHGFRRLDAYEGLVRVSKFTSEGERGSLLYAESTKSRLFLEMASKKFGSLENRVSSETIKRADDIEMAISSLSRQYDFAMASESEGPEQLSEIQKQLKEAKTSRETFVAKIRVRYPEYASVRYPQPIPVENIALGPDEILLEYEVTETLTRLFVVKRGTVAAVFDLPLSRINLESLVRSYRRFFDHVETTDQLGDFDPMASKKLCDILLGPALSAKDSAGNPLIPESSRLIIVPDEFLGLLPFESLALSVPKKYQSASNAHGPAPVGVVYFGDRYDVTYAQSATAMTLQKTLVKDRTSKEVLFVLADPVFGSSDNRMKGVDGSRWGSTQDAAVLADRLVKNMGMGGIRSGKAAKEPGVSTGFPRLDQTGLLADDLKNKVFAGNLSTVITGLAANEKDLRQRDLSHIQYLVFATHGVLDGQIPYLKEPALVLTQVGTDLQWDGFLALHEVMDLKLNADLVALTACQTGLGKEVSGEGVMGLGRAFQYAGARSVLVSLWNVAEDSTTMLIEKFFEHIKDGQSQREALRSARADVRRAGYEHPFYWSPFILIGS